jgi:hypothetical protein
MKTLLFQSMLVRLEIAVSAFFLFAALALLVVYAATSSIYAQSLSLTSSPADRSPAPVTLFRWVFLP